MTSEEYRSCTAIKSVEIAKSELSRINSLFIISVSASLLLKTLIQDQTTASLVYMSLWLVFQIYFVMQCMRLAKLTKPFNKAWVPLAVLFAPVSWIWFYADLTRPLKIIVGEIDPPQTKVLSAAKMKQEVQSQSAADRRRTMCLLGGLALAIVLLVIVIAVKSALGIK
jgi:hypothetical protein